MKDGKKGHGHRNLLFVSNGWHELKTTLPSTQAWGLDQQPRSRMAIPGLPCFVPFMTCQWSVFLFAWRGNHTADLWVTKRTRKASIYHYFKWSSLGSALPNAVTFHINVLIRLTKAGLGRWPRG